MKRVRCVLAVVLAAVLLFGCTGCGSDIIYDTIDPYCNLEEELAAHAAQEQQLQTTHTAAEEASREAELYIYYDDTESMMGFAQAQGGNNLFTEMLDTLIDEGKSMLDDGISRLHTYTLVDENPDDGVNQELLWTEIDNLSLEGQCGIAGFYTGSHAGHREGTLNGIGPLARLFQDGNNPFGKNKVTVVISDLQEQGFEMDTLTSALTAYCAADPSAQVSVIACTSPYEGELSVPVYSISGTGTDMVTIRNYDGEAAVYYIVAGPSALVEEYLEEVLEEVENEPSVRYASFTGIESTLGEPLLFTAVSNTMQDVSVDDLVPFGEEKAALAEEDDFDEEEEETPEDDEDDEDDADDEETAPAKRGESTAQRKTDGRTSRKEAAANSNTLNSPYIDRVWGSANIGAVTVREGDINVFSTEINPTEGNGKCSAFGAISQLALIADLPSGAKIAVGRGSEAPDDDTYWIDMDQLQIFEQTEAGWVSADDSAYATVSLRADTLEGPLQEYNTGEVLLSDTRYVAYLRLCVNNESGALSSGVCYRFVLPIHTSMKQQLQQGAEQLLADFSADATMYAQALNALAKEGQYYNFAASSLEAQQAARAQFVTTPKVDILINRLANQLAEKTDGDVEYLDVIFTPHISTGKRG